MNTFTLSQLGRDDPDTTTVDDEDEDIRIGRSQKLQVKYFAKALGVRLVEFPKQRKESLDQ